MKQALALSFLAGCSEVQNLGDLHYDAEKQTMQISIDESPICDEATLLASNIAATAFPNEVFSPAEDLRIQVVEPAAPIDDYTLSHVNLKLDPAADADSTNLEPSGLGFWSGDFLMGSTYAADFQAALMQVLEEGNGEKECL